MSTAPRRVVVTGLGATTPVGGDVASTWEGLLAGRSGVRTLEDERYAELPVRFAGQAAVDPSEVLERPEARKLDRSQQLALIASREAWKDAGTPEIDPLRLGVAVATGIGGIVSLLDNYDILNTRGWSRVSPMSVPQLMPNGSAAWVGLDLGAQAGIHTPVSACASGAEAVNPGLDMIRNGRADIVMAGGTEACIHPITIAAFAAMRALSTRNDDPATASRPYDVNRDGFVMGEGAGMLVLEDYEHALARGATIYAEVAGVGLSADGHHIAQPEPEGRGASRAIRSALESSGLAASDIIHVNAHATSTPQGDGAEALAIRAALGDATDGIAVSGTKSM
ncbi:MAG: beta-ketoacyl synthase, partial [Candidatus Nanopelagicales bacterium]